ncbi:MAG: hypothetical protein RLZZ414_104 [Bacteroidota bacterium]|jgi:hypothetical protein
MLTHYQKISILQSILKDVGKGYSESFKTDVLFYFGDFEVGDVKLDFLKGLQVEVEIKARVELLLSQIVLKFNEEEDSLGDFIFYELSRK